MDGLSEHEVPYAPAYIAAIPFILAGPDEHPDVYAELKDRILTHSDYVYDFNWRSPDRPAVIDDWIASITAFRNNCLFDIADYLVLYFLEPNYTVLQVALGIGDYQITDAVESKIYSVVELVPPDQLQSLAKTGNHPSSSGFAREMAVIEQQRRREEFVNDTCLTFFDEQSKLRKGIPLTDVQRPQIIKMCDCAYDRMDHPSHFSLIVSTDLRHAFSQERLNAGRAVGTCSLELGLDKMQ